MKSTNTLELKKLADTYAVIERFIINDEPEDRTEYRLQLLEAASSRLGGFDLLEFHERFGISSVCSHDKLINNAQEIVRSIDHSGIHPALALSALARETLDENERRTSGAYHTDFRLALQLAKSRGHKFNPDMKVIDPACGAGILLAAVSVVACGSDRILASEWMRNCVYAADLSPHALRGTLIALSSFTDDIDALEEMRQKWRVQNSLLVQDKEWAALAKVGFDLVIANPPWKKIKLSRHEYSKANGQKRHYGSTHKKGSLVGYEKAKIERAKLSAQLVDRYPTLSTGEPDLYVAFTELAIKLTRDGGRGSLIVPAGLIRSLNTRQLRSKLIAACSELNFMVMENRARHFAIDTRFKFLLVNYEKVSNDKQSCKKIGIAHASANDIEILPSKIVNIPVSTLLKFRPDLTLPELKTAEEWRLFKKMQQNTVSQNDTDSAWYPSFCREVDMTREKQYFRKSKVGNSEFLPVIEGRMVQPHRLGCKFYVSGEGRSAVWENLAPGKSCIKPQFWMPVSKLSEQTRKRTKRIRAGFCDITGQTNERSMMAALIPPNVVCGNKVPTVEFPNDSSEERVLLWLSIVNSLPFDWILRRIVTTTVNYFVLKSIKLPPIEIESLPARRLIEITKRLTKIDQSSRATFDSCWKIASLKAEADVLVAKAYGCNDADLELILNDFPLIDRGQPCLAGENRSTITRDLLLFEWNRRKRKKCVNISERINDAKKLGAIAYLSSEFVSILKTNIETAHEQ